MTILKKLKTKGHKKSAEASYKTICVKCFFFSKGQNDIKKKHRQTQELRSIYRVLDKK